MSIDRYIDGDETQKFLVMSSVTWVTALLKSKEGVEYHRRYFDLFRPLAESGLNLVVFMSEHLIPEASSLYPRIDFYPVILEDLESYRVTMTEGTRLPLLVGGPKDSKQYMAIINAKTELVLRAMNLDRPKTTHYGWIDFGISHITLTPADHLAHLKSQCERLVTPLLAIPGATQRPLLEVLTLGVSWRFCGGLFVGDAKSVKEFCELSNRVYKDTVEKTGIVVWEVNNWARLELEHGWQPDWFPANHNWTMLTIPEYFLSSN